MKKQWNLDLIHSEVSFKIRHMMISNVSGIFKNANASMLVANEDFIDAEINFEADVNSINTGNEQRDEHLISSDFFDANQFPKISFKSSSFEKKSEGQYVLNGELTIRDVTRPISLEVEYTGTVVDPYGQTKAGFEMIGKISRSEFGLTWSAVTEAGGVVLGDDVKLTFSIQMVAA
ncbi:MAG: hypothetical protein RL362_1481 [Bacteroidota bacterium]